MAAYDKDRRTEPPTPRRLRKARQRGQVAKSQVLTRSAVVLLLGAGLPWLVRYSAAYLLEFSSALFRVAGASRRSDATSMAGLATWIVVDASLPWLGGALLIAIVVGMAQVGPLFAPKALAPSLERLSPASGLRRVFSRRNVLTVLLAAVAAVTVGLACTMDVLGNMKFMVPTRTSSSSLQFLDLAWRLFLKAGALLLVFGILDYVLARRENMRDLFMTPEEAKREYKEQEGDPEVRARRRDVHRDLADRLGMAAVSMGDVLILGDGCLAILQYRPDEDMAAPVVLEVSAGEQASRLVYMARAEDKPVVFDPWLAAELSACEPGDYVPERLYDPVAALYRELLAGSRRERAEQKLDSSSP